MAYPPPPHLLGRTFEVFAPAKANLALRIVGRRADGYHLLEMFNVLLGFGDTVRLTVCEAGVRRVGGRVEGEFELPGDFADVGRNLAARAADLFLSAYKYDLGFAIDITKRIPSGAGLGGGSSDAAAVLRIVREALDPDHTVSPEELAAIGLKLGADVPFFLGGQHALVRGIGEILEPVPVPRFGGIECLIIVPPVGVPTPVAYKRYRESRPIVPPRRPGERSLPALVDSGAIEELIGNDLEEVVTTAYPEVGAALRLVRSSSGAVAGMTGSGSAIFCLPTLGRTFPQGFAGEMRSRLGCPVISTSIVG